MSTTSYVLLVAAFLEGGLVGFAGIPANSNSSDSGPSIPFGE
jgi:hypothetical protein